MITLKAKAKINLFLEITGRLDNGYHTISTVMHEIDLFDTVTLTETSTGNITITYNSLLSEVFIPETTYRVGQSAFFGTKFYVEGIINGDDYILIRSSQNCGFFKSKKPEVIAAYRREVYNRAMNTLKPLKKIKRVLNRNEQITIDDLLLFGDGIEPLNFDE